jgi:predicted nucleic acid-binding protein
VILYLDTSSLVKLYVEETYSELVRDWAEAAEAVATSRVAYPEALSAFARRRQAGDLTGETFDRVQRAFDSDWPGLVTLPVKERPAGTLAVKHLLRGFDAIHLSAAADLVDLLAPDSVVFSSFDARLLAAARAEGIPALLPAPEWLPG